MPQREQRGEANYSWKGGRTIDTNGYVRILCHGHPRAMSGGYVFEHILVAEGAAGRPLTRAEVVHHINHNKGDNRAENLLILPNNAEHLRLHAKERAFAACGNAEWKLCAFCKKYDARSNMTARKSSFVHAACNREYHAKWREQNKNKIAGYAAKYGAANTERLCDNARAYRAENRDHVLALKRAAYARRTQAKRNVQK